MKQGTIHPFTFKATGTLRSQKPEWRASGPRPNQGSQSAQPVVSREPQGWVGSDLSTGLARMGSLVEGNRQPGGCGHLQQQCPVEHPEHWVQVPMGK